MGFVGNRTVVSESVGSFIETVRVFQPEPDESLPVQFFLNLETQDCSAGEDGWGRVTVNDIIKVEKYEIKFTYFIDDDEILMTCRGPRGPNVKIHKHNKHKVIITGGCVVFS